MPFYPFLTGKIFNKKTTLLILGLAVVVFLFAPTVTLASSGPLENYGLTTARDFGLGTNNLIETIARIVQVILGFLGILAVLLILYAGFIWMTAAGDPAKIDKAKKIIINAVIGLIIIFSAFAIVSFIINQLWGGRDGSWGPRPGSGNDLSRWGIGAGPIQSVYPAPNQRDVPINTWLAVTFKEPIMPATICNVADVNDSDKCDGDTMLNIDVCKLGDNNLCETETGFSVDKFVGSTVWQTADARTFVITPKIYLGLEDLQNREFMVTLKEGISRAADGESVLERLIGRQFSWSFVTNGELDLDPPEILSTNTILNPSGMPSISGVSPAPDEEADGYSPAIAPTATKFSYTIFNQANLTPEINSAYTSPVSAPSSPSATISGSYGGTASGEVTVTIQPDGKTVAVDWPGIMDNYSGSYSQGQTINIGPYGLTFSLTEAANEQGGSWAVGGNSWKFAVTAYQPGDYVEVLSDSQVIKKYVFGRDIAIGQDAAKTTANITSALISGSGDIFKKESDSSIVTKEVGENSSRYSLNFVLNKSVIFSSTKIDGLNASQNQTVNDQPDVYRNQLFELQFNEPINPIFIDNIVIKYDRNNDGDFDDAEDVLDDFTTEISADYTTVGLRGSIECGLNTCGNQMYCWPMYDGAPEQGVATHYQVEIKASDLMVCSDPRCDQWQGACVGGSDNRCARRVGDQMVFYPGVGANLNEVNGIIDLAGNSLNGSFDYYQENGQVYGLANGPKSFYDLNLSNPPFSQSNPEANGFGDNFRWSFWVSTEIDRQAPLIMAIVSEDMTGGAMTSNLNQPVNFSFDRLMRSASLKPGWNYGPTSDQKSRTTRYLALNTLTVNANPVGFWVTKVNYDQDNDGWPDYTSANLQHHILDLYAAYAPLVGSGAESITQNCFLPSAGPIEAGSGQCQYTSEGITSGCVKVRMPNPASYGYLKCSEITDAEVCLDENYSCQPLYENASDDISGSWVITKDYPTVDPASGRTGCCFGKCKSNQ